MNRGLVRIVAAKPSDPSGITLTQGTQVLLPDGTPIPGVTRIMLVAGVNSVWKAQITLHCRAPDVPGLFVVREPAPRYTWWDRLLGRRRPVIDITDLGSSSRRFSEG